MRILLFTQFPLDGCGSGTYTRVLAKELTRHGHEVLLVYPEYQRSRIEFPSMTFDCTVRRAGRRLVPCFSTLGSDSIRFSSLNQSEMRLITFRIHAALAAACQAWNPTLVHINHLWMAVQPAISLGFPTVVTVHGTELAIQEENSELRGSIGRSIQEVGALIAVSDHVLHKVALLYLEARHKITRVWNCADSEICARAVSNRDGPWSELGIEGLDGGEHRIICFVGKISTHKGVHVLLQAAKMYEKKVPNVITLLIGTGTELNALVDMAGKCGLRRVRFVGLLPHEYAIRAMAKADIVVVPSLSEPFGLTAIEAITTGVPVVASNVGGLSEFVTLGGGILVPPGLPDELAEAILSILNTCERKRREPDIKPELNLFRNEVWIDTICQTYMRCLENQRGKAKRRQRGLDKGFKLALVDDLQAKNRKR